MSDATFTQADVDRIVKERLAAAKTAADTRHAEAMTQVDEWKGKAAQYEADAKRAAALETELTGIKTASERAAAWDAAGVPADLRPRLERLYEADTAGEAKPLADWLAANAEDPLIMRVLGTPTAPSGAPSAPQGTPTGAAGQRPPPVAPGANSPNVGRVNVDALRAQMRDLSAQGKHDEARAVFQQVLAADSAPR
jgi:hypothetical protein